MGKSHGGLSLRRARLISYTTPGAARTMPVMTKAASLKDSRPSGFQRLEAPTSSLNPKPTMTAT